MLVWYPTGVKKLKFAANSTARINGLSERFKLLATEIAIVSIITAVALLEIVPLRSIVAKKIVPRIIVSLCPTRSSSSFSEIHISAPLLLMATPKGIIPANRNIICQSTFLYVSIRAKLLDTRNKATPKSELVRIDNIPDAAKPTTYKKMPSAISLGLNA